MTRRMLLMLALAAMVAPQFLSRAIPQNSKAGTIEGVVKRAGTSDPISGVQITLAGSGAAETMSVEQA